MFIHKNCAALIIVSSFISSVIMATTAGELVLLHTNDIHARVTGVKADDSMCRLSEIDSERCFGGFDRIFTKVQEERKKHKNVLMLDAGDQFQGTMFHLMYHGMASAKFMNMIGYDAMAAGNHEFDNGQQVLATFLDALKFPMLSANIDISSAALLKKIKPYIIKRVNGIRVGILGYTTQDTATLSNPGDGVQFLPIIESVKKTVLALKREHVDVIVAVSHSGLNKDIEVAQQVDGIAAIICGHSNSLLANTVKNADGPSPLVVLSPAKKPVLLVSAYAFGKYLGKLQFSFDKNGVPTKYAGEPILLDKRVARNSKILKEIKNLYAPIEAYEKRVVGTAPMDIDGKICRHDECLFGNVIADSMLAFTSKMGAQIALMNGGGIRSSIKKGPVSEAQLKDVLPIDKTLVLLKLKGATVRQAVEHSVSFAEDMKNDNTGRFLQVSGLRYSFDTRKPRGSRVQDIFIVNNKTNMLEPLQNNDFYSVVTNSYLARGGDGFAAFSQFHEKWSIDIELKDVLAQHFQTAMAHPPRREGRIINLAESPTPSWHSKLLKTGDTNVIN